MKSILLELVAVVSVLFLGAFFRFQHLDWDHGYLFHPDERQILLVSSKLALPASPVIFFTSESQLDPQFFSYGSLPIYLIRLVSSLNISSGLITPWQDPGFASMALAGRAISGIFDLGTLLVIYLIGRTLYDGLVGVIAGIGYAVTVLAIQLSHFYAVDSLLTFFTTATFWFIARYARFGRRRDLFAQGLFFGLALASKITAIPLIVPIIFGLILVAARQGKRARTIATNALTSTIPRALEDYWEMVRAPLGIVLGFTLIVFVVTQPYALIDLTHYASDVYRETLIARGWLDVPYTRQFAGTLPFIYQIQQSTTWSMGMPLGMLVWVGAFLFAVQWFYNRDDRDGLILLWATTYFLFVGGQYVKYLRYLLPAIPIFLLMASRAFTRAHASISDLRRSRVLIGWLPAFVLVFGIIGGAIWAFAFTSVYAREHEWLQASQWMYSNIPSGASLLLEQWDEPLPELLLEDGQRREANTFRIIQNPIFDPEDSSKTERMVRNMREADYVVLASQRGYGAIPRVNSGFPITTRYYEALFDGRLGFEPVYVDQSQVSFANLAFTDDPFADADLIPPMNLEIGSYSRVWNLGRADESFTVYDHPLTIIFHKTRVLSVEELRTILLKR